MLNSFSCHSLLNFLLHLRIAIFVRQLRRFLFDVIGQTLTFRFGLLRRYQQLINLHPRCRIITYEKCEETGEYDQSSTNSRWNIPAEWAEKIDCNKSMRVGFEIIKSSFSSYQYKAQRKIQNGPPSS